MVISNSLSLSYDLFILLKGRVREGDSPSNRWLMPWVAASAQTGPGEARSQELPQGLAQECGSPSPWAGFCSFPGALAERWMGSAAAETPPGTSLGRRHCRQWFNLLCHSASPSDYQSCPKWKNSVVVVICNRLIIWNLYKRAEAQASVRQLWRRSVIMTFPIKDFV